ncbi:MAG: MBL fold metallo-hydrolase [Chitinophagaceae bacterium]|nr:MBL fold metallo-hydrolase [Chitinophagaceae bacterium]
MNRRLFIRNSLLAGGALALGPRMYANGLNFADWKIHPIRKDVYLFTERGGSIVFLRNKTGTVVVDSQFPEQAGHLIGELKKTAPVPFDLLINTHHHGDHSGGNIAFKGQVKQVLAHINSKINQENQAKAQQSEDKQLYPDLTFSDKWCVDFGKEKICAHYFGPGHTNGDALIHFENANIVHMGDLLANKRYPYIDRGAGASMENWMLILDRAQNVFDRKTLFVCGHGRDANDVIVNRDYLREMKFFFESIFDHVKKEIVAGKTKEQIIATPAIPMMESWVDPNSFVKPLLETAYHELTIPA